MNITLIAVGFVAGLLSGAIGFGGAMILIPVIIYYYGVEVAVPLSTVAQLMSNLFRSVIGYRQVVWKRVGIFLLLAVPFTALGAVGFALAPKELLTRLLCVFLVIFAILKLIGKIHLPQNNATMLVGGGLTGVINGLMGISGPLSSAVFLTLELSPVAYVVSEATAATAMHIVKIVVYGKLNLLTGGMLLTGATIGLAMICGNFIALKLIKHAHKKKYQKIVAGFMIAVSLWLFFSV